jgi:alkanesulfonate monooxygenase SsuD/methylene tetrahydromethanopterin reductase-like flavin-dependent oxidoreductase (luciferase family)
MQLGLDLPAYWPDTGHPIENLFPEMIEAAQHAEDIGFSWFVLAEHHFIDYFVSPAPLTLASHLAAMTKSARFLISVLCLTIHDVRRVAGEINTADHLTKGRLDIGLGRGSNRYEPARMGVPFDELPEIFEDKLAALLLLLRNKDVSYEGPHVKFPSLTIMPPPLQKPHAPLWIACIHPESTYDAARRGFNVQTASLRRPFEVMREVVQAFRDGAAEAEPGPRPQQISMQVWVYVTKSEAETREKLEMAYANHRRFMNLYITPGTVLGGLVQPIDIEESAETVGKKLIIGPPQFCTEKILEYQQLDIDHLVMRMHFGPPHRDILGSLDRFAEHVMPCLDVPTVVAPRLADVAG